MFIGITIGLAIMWAIARLSNEARNARVRREFARDHGGNVQSFAGQSCYIHCVSNGFPWVGATCTIICPGGGGGGNVR